MGTEVIRIVGVAASLRQGSYNAAVLRAAAALMPPDSELVTGSIAGIPLFNEDEEKAHGLPAAVTQLKEAIATAHGLLWISPEYNNSLPGVAKNALDWLSRPPADTARIFRGRPVAIAGGSPGGFGTVLGQNAWLPVFRTLGTDLWSGGRLMVSRVPTLLGPDGEIADPATRDAIRQFMAGFVTYIRRGS